jgi:hypothetical protein
MGKQRRGLIGLAFSLCACGRLGFENTADSLQDAVDGATAVDGAEAKDANGSIDAQSDAAPNTNAPGCKVGEANGPLTNQYDTGQPAYLTTANRAPAVVRFETGVLKLIPSPSGRDQGATAFTRDPYSFLNRRIFTEVPSMSNVTKEIDVFFYIFSDTNTDRFLEISQFNGTLSANSWANSARTNFASMPYDPIAHRWWQLHEAAGFVAFETSPDGVEWTTLATTNSPSWYASAHLAFDLYVPRAVSGVLGEAHFDNTFDCQTP